jgi:ABC-2 type transport system permease protein
VTLILRKDVRTLLRTPVLAAVLLAYPLMIAALVGLVAGYANLKPRVALVDRDGLPPRIVVANRTFDITRTIDEIGKNVTLVRLDEDEAARQLADGRVVAVVTVPPGFAATLREMVRSPTLELAITRGGTSARVRQQVQSLVYSLNQRLQRAYIDANLSYVRLLLKGGNGRFLGRDFKVLGLQGTQRELEALPPGRRVARIEEFVRAAKLGLAQTGAALRATAAPIALRELPDRGRTATLSAQAQAYALALTLTFLCLVLAAGALAAERDEGVLPRLARGLVSAGRMVGAKVLLAAVVAVVVGLAIALVFGLAIEIGDVTGGEPWVRLPLLAAGVAVAGGAIGAVGAAIGALAREARTASLVAVLVVLPVVFLGLIPREIFPAAAWASDLLPFVHAFRLFDAALYDLSPWGAVATETAWLVALGVVSGVAARFAVARAS